MINLLKSPLLARANSGLAFRPDANTVLWLPGQDDAYSSTIRDRSGFGNNGTITGATWARTDKGLWYLDFDGSDDLVNCGVDASLHVAAITVLFWVKYDGTDSGATLIGKYDSVPGNWEFVDYAHQMGFRVWAANDGSTNKTSPIKDLRIGGEDWRMITGLYDDPYVRLYVDAVQIGTGTETGGGSIARDASAPLTLGERFFPSAESNAKGGLALVRIYSRALTLVEIQGFYNQERHLFGV